MWFMGAWHGKNRHLASLSKAATRSRYRFFGHIMRRLAGRLVHSSLKSSSEFKREATMELLERRDEGALENN
ncbi:hypothetical protein RB195_011461 [Necator americanus]|uniref:Uncharacterized protein n=1 Tax=Necator americanus TaxID=51031 RepID=A0ABR1D3M4_NECAM